jgi:hypothetical protein
MLVYMNVDTEKLRYALVGNGYILEEVEKLSEDQLIAILEKRVEDTITKEYYKGLRFGLYDRKD